VGVQIANTYPANRHRPLSRGRRGRLWSVSHEPVSARRMLLLTCGRGRYAQI